MKVLLVCLFAAVYAKHEVYLGWKSFYVKPSSHDQLKGLGSLIPKLELDFIIKPTVDREGIVLVRPPYQDDFLNFLASEKIEHWIHAEDVKAQLDKDDQMIEEYMQERRSTKTEGMSYDRYQQLDIIYKYLDTVASKYSDIVKIVTPATSFENRPLTYLKISKDNFKSGKPVIFLDGAMHAREWITVPTVTYAIHKLVENVTEPDLLDRFDWILFPVVNPDGYQHSFDRERMWRKTRSTDQHSMGRICRGVDINRNFDFVWNTTGTESHPCSDIFPGSKALSEVETRVVNAIFTEHKDKMVMYLSVHSFGSMILYPWSNNGTLSDRAFALHTVGIRMADAINAFSVINFPRYRVGNSALVLDYFTSGSSDDYAHSIGVPLAYTLELPGRGSNGFVLHPRYIKPVIAETWAGVVVGARMAGDLFGSR
ncbi:carboxypeptidase B-like [Pararge aegeria]|uniref:Jg16897 protein n=1 Tax=Pararge aegeria aegeria TaxID=348720 RepID=A0A8S4SNL1_9NEOP|nr:carboxypeptidase B-like [Pararge aegeria]CAH2268467.1 jg16897 [Pararge aegeria aegeria]